MTLDDAITYYDEMAETCRRNARIESNDYMDMRDSASEAEQIASWLNELKLLRERIETQPEPCEVAVSAMAVEEMLKNLLPERGMWEIEGDDAKTAICETIHDALEGLWKMPFVKPDSNKSSVTQKALDTISRQAAIDALNHMMDIDGFRDGWAVSRANVDCMLKALPSAQPEIIRCKYCRWGKEACGNIECFVDSNIPTEYHGYEWFCPNGERRTDG